MSAKHQASPRSGRWGWYLLLILPCIAVLFPQIYDSTTPSLFGMPFYYGYQLLLVPVSGLLTGLVYLVTR